MDSGVGARARHGDSVYLENYYWMSSVSSTLSHFHWMTCRAALRLGHLAPWAFQNSGLLGLGFSGMARLLGISVQLVDAVTSHSDGLRGEDTWHTHTELVELLVIVDAEGDLEVGALFQRRDGHPG